MPAGCFKPGSRQRPARWGRGSRVRARRAALLAGVSGAAAQYATDKTGDPLIGMAAGALPAAAIGAGAGMVNRLTGTVEPATAALAETARNKFGIPLGVGQISESPAVKMADSVVNKLPMSGAGPARAAQQASFNRAVSNTFGESAEKITPDVMQSAKTRLGGEFDRIASKSTIPLDDGLINDLGTTIADAQGASRGQRSSPLRRRSRACWTWRARRSHHSGRVLSGSHP